MLQSGENCRVDIDANSNAKNGRDSEQICAAEIMYNFGTNRDDHQNDFSKIIIEVHTILTILCVLY